MTTMIFPDRLRRRAPGNGEECWGGGALSIFGAGLSASRAPAAGPPAAGSPAAGFTLIEVLVALAVVAVALPALLFSLNQQVDGTAYLRDKSLAGMVAANKLEEVRIVSRAQQNLLKGQDSGVVEMADQEWFWWSDSQPTEVDQFYRIEILVAREETQRDTPLAKLVAYLIADLKPAAGSGGQGGN
jgi:general secretion pathway protein I